jgi:hypothetical protein
MEVQAQGRGTGFLGSNDVYTSFMVARIVLGCEFSERTRAVVKVKLDYSMISDYSQRLINGYGRCSASA